MKIYAIPANAAGRDYCKKAGYFTKARVNSFYSNHFDAVITESCDGSFCLYKGCAHLGGNDWKFVYGNNRLVSEKVLKELIGKKL